MRSGERGELPARRAFEELFSEHLDALYRTALRLCAGRESDAEDLLQEAALRAFLGFDRLQHQEAGRAWLFTILTRTHLNRVRGAKRRRETVFTDLDEGAFEEALERWERSTSVEDKLARHELRETLADALNRLPPPLRAAVWLVYGEGLRLREVAKMLGVPEGTVASRLYRGRSQLREDLAGRVPDAKRGLL